MTEEEARASRLVVGLAETGSETTESILARIADEPLEIRDGSTVDIHNLHSEGLCITLEIDGKRYILPPGAAPKQGDPNTWYTNPVYLLGEPAKRRGFLGVLFGDGQPEQLVGSYHTYTDRGVHGARATVGLAAEIYMDASGTRVLGDGKPVNAIIVERVIPQNQ